MCVCVFLYNGSNNTPIYFFPIIGNVRALMQKAEEYTVFIKNSVAFPYFGDDFSRNNLIGNNGRPCIYGSNEDHTINNGCQIFKLGDMVTYAGGNFSQ